MARKNTVCTVLEPVTNAAKNPSPTCPGTIIPYEFPISINGKVYPRYEKCLRCGQIYPG